MFPAARIMDLVNHDGKTISGTIGAPLAPCGHRPVHIEGLQGAHVGCTVVCSGTTAEAILHPPIVPTGVAPCPGCSVSLPPSEIPSSDEDEEDEDDPGWDGETWKTFQIRLVGGGSLSGAVGIEVLSAGGKIDGLLFEIRDPATGDSNKYVYAGAGYLAGGGTPVAGEWKHGGEFQDFNVPSTLEVDQFDGFFDIKTAGANYSPTGGVSYVSLGIKTWVTGEHFWQSGPREIMVPGFDPGPSFQLGSLWEISESNGIFIDYGDIEKGEVHKPTASIPVQTSAPIVMGSKTVNIHGKPAAVWNLPGSVSCGAALGPPPPAAIGRSVFMGV